MFKGYCSKNDVICHAQIPCFAFLLIFKYMQLLVSVSQYVRHNLSFLKINTGKSDHKNNRLKSVRKYIAFIALFVECN